jgi:hypothetical protein
MTAKGILDAAYKARIVPQHLYGKTQEKTLQARLSEDILYHHNKSAFFRTEPGYFFLVEFISDPDIPEKFKEIFAARRRARDLRREPSLTIDKNFIAHYSAPVCDSWQALVRAAEEANAIHYLKSRDDLTDTLVVWTFSVVRRGTNILSYRLGRYRDSRDTFANKRTIGFPGIVSLFDCTLFSDGDYGAGENALAAISSDLDISAAAIQAQKIGAPCPKLTLQVKHESEGGILLLVMEWACPDWFEPTTRRLSLNDPRWIDSRVAPNNIDDFEPWTLATLKAFNEMGGCNSVNDHC